MDLSFPTLSKVSEEVNLVTFRRRNLELAVVDFPGPQHRPYRSLTSFPLFTTLRAHRPLVISAMASLANLSQPTLGSTGAAEAGSGSPSSPSTPSLPPSRPVTRQSPTKPVQQAEPDEAKEEDGEGSLVSVVSVLVLSFGPVGRGGGRERASWVPAWTARLSVPSIRAHR